MNGKQGACQRDYKHKKGWKFTADLKESTLKSSWKLGKNCLKK